jgi:hypothetical protein
MGVVLIQILPSHHWQGGTDIPAERVELAYLTPLILSAALADLGNLPDSVKSVLTIFFLGLFTALSAVLVFLKGRSRFFVTSSALLTSILIASFSTIPFFEQTYRTS